MAGATQELKSPMGLRNLTFGWRQLTLAGQFMIAGSVVLLIGMLVIGTWVTAKIEDGVTRNSAAATALYMESVVTPLLQELARSDRISPATRGKLDAILSGSELGRKIVSFKVWKEGGLVAYSSRASITGRTFPVTPNLRAAWSGEVRAEFDRLTDEEDALERGTSLPLLEMYSPIRETHTGRIIAVAEFYENAVALKKNLFNASLQSWLVVAGVTLAMLAAISGIVLRGSRTIVRQRRMLELRIDELSRLLDQNEELRARLQHASYRAAEVNEQYLRRIGADLHDGPAQSMALAALRLDSLQPAFDACNPDGEGASNFTIVREALRDAIAEVREISAGLSLPEVDDMSLRQILEHVVAAHERRTGTDVTLTIGEAPADLDRPLKIGIFRFVQEGLNNAFRHAGGSGQTVACAVDGSALRVEVRDRGPGFAQPNGTDAGNGLGLLGLRERIESLGGRLEILSTLGKGTRLVMHCSLDKGEGRHDG